MVPCGLDTLKDIGQPPADASDTMKQVSPRLQQTKPKPQTLRYPLRRAQYVDLFLFRLHLIRFNSI
jgi:hypothetical protein